MRALNNKLLLSAPVLLVALLVARCDSIGDEPELITPFDLSIEKSATPVRVRQGDPVAFTIMVTSREKVEVSDIEVTDILPEGLSFVRVIMDSTSQVRYDPLTGVVWNVDEVPAEGRVILRIIVRVNDDAPQEITNTATITEMPEGDVDESNNEDSASIIVQ